MQTAFVTNSVMAAASIAFCFVLRFCLKRSNMQMDKEEADTEASSLEKTDGQTEGAFVKKIRYVL